MEKYLEKAEKNQKASADTSGYALIMAIFCGLLVWGASLETQNKSKTEQELKKEYIDAKQDSITTTINYINQRQK